MAGARNAINRPIFDYQFSPLSMDEIAKLTMAPPPPGSGVRLIVTANLHHIIQLRSNAGLRAAYDHAYVRTIDGAPVMLYAILRGAQVPERVTGADIVPPLLRQMTPGVQRIFFMAGNDKIADGLLAWARDAGFGPDQVIAEVPPWGFEHDAAYSDALAARIRDNGTTHLFVGIGCPKSEIWVDERRDRLGDCFAFAVGAALAFFVGEQRRAPMWMREAGFEWLWRVSLEPRRLSKRYFIDSWGFILAVFTDMFGRSRRP